MQAFKDKSRGHRNIPFGGSQQGSQTGKTAKRNLKAVKFLIRWQYLNSEKMKSTSTNLEPPH